MNGKDLIDPTAQILLKEGLKQTEEDIKSGLLTADVAVDSLAELDAYFMSARQANGERVTGVVLRTRVKPHAYFMIPGLVVLGAATSRILEQRLPPAPPPTPKPSAGSSASAEPVSSAQAKAKAAAVNPLVKAKTRAVAKANKLPPGALDPSSLVPPSLDSDERVPQG